MSVIVVEGFSLTVTLDHVTKLLCKSIEGSFQPINFVNTDCKFKTCYVRLSENLNPLEVIDNINNAVHGRKMNVLKACLASSLPNFPPKPVFLHKNLRKKLGIPAGELKPQQILSVAHLELMTELQFKYPLLSELSSKSSHRLLNGIGMTVQERLEKIMAQGGEHTYDPSLLTARYRKMHPHFGDFMLIRNTLYRLENAAGERITKLQEFELIPSFRDMKQKINAQSNSSGKVQTLTRYNKRIANKLELYVQNYDLTPHPYDSKEERARKQVRAGFAQMVSHIPAMLYELKMKHFPKARPPDNYEKIRMYGEPCLPPEEVLQKLFKRFRAQRVSRRKTMYNLYMFDVPIKATPKVLELDGSCWDGSKLVIRSTYVNCHLVNVKLKNVTESSEVKIEAASSTAQ